MARKILDNGAAEARRLYQREHYAQNKEQYREKMRRYWARRAEKLQPGGEVQEVNDAADTKQ